MLVGFRTVSDQSNLDLVDWVRDYLDSHDVPCFIDYNREGNKAGIYAMIGPPVSGGVVLSGHTDVVPVAGQQWTTDPWTLVEKEGRLYGRGACDMKGFDAIVLSRIPAMKSAGLDRPIQIALSRDEEIGCIGAPPMIARMKEEFPPVSAVIVGEPTMMKVVTGHKGNNSVAVRVRGHEVHSSMMHRGVSAVLEASRLVEWIRQENLSSAEKAAMDGPSDFDPPYTTLHVGVIEGGTAQNITAGECRFNLEARCIPGEDVAKCLGRFEDHVRAVEKEMQKVAPNSHISLEPDFEVPPLRQEMNGTAEELARRITGDNGVHVVSYATEAGQFQQEYGSTVICGPGDIAQAHGADEFLALEQLHAGERFIDQLIGELAK